MSSRRTMILVAAIAIGAIAAFTLLRYVNGVEDRAYGNTKRVEVYVVNKDVPQNLPGDQAIADYITTKKIPQEFRPATALTELDAIRSKVAVSKLTAGQVLVNDMFVDPIVARVTNSQRIQDGRMAITVSVDQIHGVAGLIVPGDKVNVLYQLKDVDKARDLPDDEKLLATGMHTIYQNAEVLFVGQTAAPQPGETTEVEEGAETEVQVDGGLVTLSVPPEAAARIAYMQQNGGVYLSLAPPDYSPVPVPAIDGFNIVPDDLTPYEDEDER